MKLKKPAAVRQLLAVGLLSTVLPTVINDFVHIPDFFRGASLGVGLVLEVIGIIWLRRGNKFTCRHTGREMEA